MFDHLDTFPDGEGEGDEDEDEGDEGEDEVNCTPFLLLLLLLLFGLLALAVHRRRPHFGHPPASETALGATILCQLYSFQVLLKTSLQASELRYFANYDRPNQ